MITFDTNFMIFEHFDIRKGQGESLYPQSHCTTHSMISIFAIFLFCYLLGEAPDGTKYKTAYRCEGQDLRINCDPGETIQVIRANYGRFSIAICNKNGYTDWSVNCMSHTTTRILQRK